MYAIIETGGKQYRVEQGDRIRIERLKAEAGEKVEFDRILALNDDKELQIGAPYLSALKVSGTVLESGKGQKVIIFKYKAKKDYRKKQGHRQPYTLVEITALPGQTPKEPADGGETAAEKKTAAKKTEEKPAAGKKPAAKKAEDKPAAEKKPAVKKAAEKKPAAKKTEDKPAAEKKPAAKKAADKEEKAD